jgi:CHAD domain-containing protein
VWKKGGAIGPESPAEALHGLRIDCKKLRYLLEFFRSLYPSSEIDPLVKALKQLQDNLGDFNDLEVQQEKLRDFARQMVEEGEVAPATLLAMGELVAGLRRFQEEERLAFAEHFSRFSEHRRAFRRLFAGGKPL